MGGYFVTVVSQGREPLFGEILDEHMNLNQYGEIVQNAWFDLPNHYPFVVLDAFIIMPNHIHGIILLTDPGTVGSNETRPYGRGGSKARFIRQTRPSVTGQSDARPSSYGLPEIIRAVKSFSARRINTIRNTPGVPIWQRNYYEHILRNETEWGRIRQYIAQNPQNWNEDQENPQWHGVADH